MDAEIINNIVIGISIISGLILYSTTLLMAFEIKKKNDNMAIMLVGSGYWIFTKRPFHENNNSNFLTGRIAFAVFAPSTIYWVLFGG